MNLLRRHRFITLVLVAAALIRFGMLAGSQTHVHSDEAIIGLMGKHISEGRYFPVYMYGQPYNASAAGEAYLAAIVFKLFGVSVIALKSVIVLLSLVCLFLFYKMAETLFDKITAAFSTLAFVLAPSLLKWDFQVRGYSFYFLAIPTLVILFWRVATVPRPRRLIAFGLASGLSLWLLELSLTLNIALWIALIVWRRISIKQWLVALAGFIAGYAPAILYNFTHDFANWKTVFSGKTGGSLNLTISSLTRPANLQHIFGSELPKFFGPDTVLWYYPELPWMGLVFYAIAITAILAVFVPLSRWSRELRALFSSEFLVSEPGRDLMLLLCTVACFIPYLLAPIPTAAYFLGGIFFLSVLTGRLLGRWLTRRSLVRSICTIGMLAAMFVAGIFSMFRVSQRNEIETLTLCDSGGAFCMTRIPGADMTAVERHLLEHQIPGAWTTVSLVYPLIFETREKLAISAAIFGWDQNPYPPAIPPPPRPPNDQPAVVVMESESPLRPGIERRLADASTAPPVISQYGTLVVIEQRPVR